MGRAITRATIDPELLAVWEEQLRFSRKTHPGLYDTTDMHAFCPRTYIGRGKYRVPDKDDDETLQEEQARGTLTIAIITHRTRTMAKQYYDKATGLTQWHPDALYGAPSRYGFYVWKSNGNFCFHNFHATYAAQKFVLMMINDEDYKWLSDDTLITATGTKIKAEWRCSFEEVMEYVPTKQEAQFVFPVPYQGMFERFVGIAQSRPVTIDKPPSREKETKQDRLPRAPRPDDLTSLADIATELNIEPRDARQILRKTNTPKPDHGWAWAKDAVDTIKRILKSAS